MDTKQIVDAIEAGNVALVAHRELAEKALAKAEKNEGGLGDIKAAQEKAFADFHTSQKAVEDALAKLTRAGLKGAGDGEADEKSATYTKGFNDYVRGKISDQELKALEITTNSGSDGGFAMPKVIDTMIENLVVNISPIRSLANVVQIGTNDYHKLVNLKGTASGWVTETAARPATTTPTLTDIAIKAFELYANPQATQVMLDDVFFNAESWLAGEVAQEFARAEGAAFIVGTGSGQPTGFLTGTPVATADGARAFGVLQYIPTGVAANWAASNPADTIFTLIASLKAGYRDGASFVVNKNVLFALSAFKDSSGRYIYNPVQAPGVVANLLGYGVTEAEDMPTPAANAFTVAFGNFKRGYEIVDRKGMTTIRDPFSNKPYIGFYSVKRVGGAIVNSEAIKLIKWSVS